MIKKSENERDEIKLNEILSIVPEEYDQWTICLNNGVRDLHETLFDPNPVNNKRLMGHLSYKRDLSKKNSFRVISTKYCLQFLGLHNAKRPDHWLFMGAFENKGIIQINGSDEIYDLKKIDRFSHFEERLIIEYKKHTGDKQAKLNIKRIESIDVHEIVHKKYVDINIPFPGYKNFHKSFSEIANVINHNVSSWRDKLSSVQCIYAITDILAKKVYVGSTYGADGIWQRWSCYVETHGHGGDVELKKIIDKNPNYGYENFEFSILEVIYDEDIKTILERENDWKELLQTRVLGYNKN